MGSTASARVHGSCDRRGLPGTVMVLSKPELRRRRAAATRGHSVRGSADGVTYVTPHGPTPLSWTTTSSLFHAKWLVFGCRIMMLPGVRAIDFDVSSLSPTPM